MNFKKIRKRIFSAVSAGVMMISAIGLSLPSVSSVPYLTESVTASAASVSDSKITLPTGNDIVARACKLLGAPYSLGGQGTKQRNWSSGSGCPVWSTKATASEIVSGNSYAKGIDCSGLVYWTMASLGFSTKGYMSSCPVPYATSMWFKNSSCKDVSSSDTFTWTYTNSSGQSVSKTVKPVKLNQWVKGYKNSKLEYWQYRDSNGNVQELPTGSIVIAKAYKKNSSGNLERDSESDHIWIYLGEYADRNAVINALVNDYGVDRKTAKKYVVTGVNANGTANTSTHWRIESTGTEHGSSDLNHRVMIDNDKNTRETTAYSITAYKPLSVKLSIQTETEAGNLIAGKSKAFGKSATQCKYGVYYSASSAKKDKNRVATVTLNGMGKGSVKIPSDKYGSVYIKELVTPTGFKISGNVIKLTSETTVITQEKAVGSISFNQKFSDGKSGYVKYECVNTNTGKVVATKKVKITNGKAAVKFDGLPVYGYKNATASYGVYASERIKYTVRETYAKSSDGVPYKTAGKEFSVTLSKYRKGKMATGYTYVFKLGHTVINYPESGNLRLKTTFKNAEGKTVTPTSAQKSAVVFVLKNSSGKLVSKTALRKNLCKQINCDKKR